MMRGIGGYGIPEIQDSGIGGNSAPVRTLCPHRDPLPPKGSRRVWDPQSLVFGHVCSGWRYVYMMMV